MRAAAGPALSRARPHVGICVWRVCAPQVLRVLWLALMKSINLTGKNPQQITQSLVAKFKTYGKLFTAFATNGKAELALINTIQVSVALYVSVRVCINVCSG